MQSMLILPEMVHVTVDRLPAVLLKNKKTGDLKEMVQAFMLDFFYGAFLDPAYAACRKEGQARFAGRKDPLL